MQWIISSPFRPPRHRCYTSRRKDIQKGKINHISHSSFADTHNAQLVKSLHQPFYNICIHKSVGKTVNSLYSRIYYFPSYLNASIWIRGSRHQQHNVKKKKKVNTCIKSTAAACDVLVFLADGSWPFFTPDHTAKCTYGCRKKKQQVFLYCLSSAL